MSVLKVILPSEIDRVSKPVVSDQVLDQARLIIDRVRREGKSGVRRYAEKFGECDADQPLILGPNEMRDAYNSMDPKDRAVLTRAADRIERFAKAQRSSIEDLTIDVPGGEAGHTVEPIRVAGCYAPAGRYFILF